MEDQKYLLNFATNTARDAKLGRDCQGSNCTDKREGVSRERRKTGLRFKREKGRG